MKQCKVQHVQSQVLRNQVYIIGKRNDRCEFIFVILLPNLSYNCTFFPSIPAMLSIPAILSAQ